MGLSPCSYSQISLGAEFDIDNDDLNSTQDIFNDFNENIEASQVVEDERFYRYGRFFSFQIALGLTSFDGNRGAAYEDSPPSFGLGLNWFSDFQTAYGLGIEFSEHNMFFDKPTEGFNNSAVGFVEVSMLRAYFSYRYYLDTSELGTAITYSNPYFTGRLEYWYTSNKFIDQSELGDDVGGAFGFGLGLGLEFPVKLKESYLGVEFLFHSVNYHDKFTRDFASVPNSNVGVEDLTGNAFSTMVAYVISW